MSAVFTATRHKLTVEAYHDLGATGHLTEDDRIELIDGELIERAPISGPHLNARDAGVPTAKDVLLVVEVSDSTVTYDRGTKLPLYARHGLADVWLINLRSSRIEVYRTPADGGYAPMREIGPGESIPMLALPDVRLAWETVFA